MVTFNTQEPNKIEIFNTPYFDDEIISKLPGIFQSTNLGFTEKRPRDIHIFSMFIGLSSILPNLYVVHDNNVSHVNQMGFISAPAGCRKSSAMITRRIIHVIEKKMQQESEKIIDDFEESLQNWIDNGSVGDKPIKPNVPKLIVPGNTSQASLIQALLCNNGGGLIFETEGDAVTSANNRNWGNFSDLLRKIFHNEPISSNRKNGGIIEVVKPHLSMLLTGTPNQIDSFLDGNVHNGLFSRFCFYAFDDTVSFDRSVFEPGSYMNIEAEINKLQRYLLEFHNEIGPFSRIKLVYSDSNIIQKAGEVFESWYDVSKNIFGEDMHATVVRLALIQMRVAAIISIFRHYDNRSINGNVFNQMDEEIELECSYEDFEIALHFVEIFKTHSLYVFDKLRQGTRSVKVNNFWNITMNRFYELLPNSFDRKSAIVIAESISMPTRTADYQLKKMVEGKLIKHDAIGKYVKVY